ncbi:MAG: sugar phosphate nucleotidyltransferase [Deltaproteobacteria bacterium]|nr:sugar phosphate nucleotidyltransferase [Deltaproteobacteria bacterium]
MSYREDLSVVIMAGGAGTRFWPLSTEKRPKQFLMLFGKRSLLQSSFDRVAHLAPPEKVLVLTNLAFVPLVKEQLPQIPNENIIGEPMRRDTAAAVALATLICKKRFGNGVMAILTADHIIEPVELFQKTMLSAVNAASKSKSLYTIGIEPAYPATGYGYLETSEELMEEDGVRHYRIKQFKEKPDLDSARKYIKSGRFFWNSGMFVWRTESILEEFNRCLPGHLEHIAPALDKDGTKEWQKALEVAFEPLKKISIDFAVMEKAGDVRTVGAAFFWSDVGGWIALEEFLQKDNENNHYRGNVKSYDAGENLVFCEEEGETVALVGVENLIVVRTGSKTLIVEKGRAEEVKKLVDSLPEELK